MGANNFKDLIRHYGHEISCVKYGPDHEYDGDAENVALECETCGEVLLDFDKKAAKELNENS